MSNLKNTRGKSKINNKTLAGLLGFLVIIIVVWLIGYFTGIDEGKTRSTNILVKKETDNVETKKNLLPSLPQLPQISKKSSTNKLPQLPELP